MKWVVAAALVFLLVGPDLGTAAEGEEDMPDRTKLGEFVPSSQPFAAPTISLTDSDGHTLELSDLRGKLVVVNLWATWCEPCLREMPSLERLQSRLGERIAVLAVSEDRGGNKSVEPFIAKLGLKSVKIYIDPKSEVGHAFGARGLPTSFLIDREGKVLGRVEGAAEWDSPKILGVLEPLLSGDGVVKASSR
ncbi:MAG TPA: TlpA disulfide reductase family protein [Stellaceae bacterium]|jgi:thiol-disulfide isomerase/thioredoxin|nr:TlpA disulfide reductase family protein [Stellaceae bacterium]